MCGITGFISPELNQTHLQSITRELQHRGPDAEGFFFSKTKDRNIGLGHRRLSILDLSEAANQPFRSRDGRYTMVFNGEVYNFKEVAGKYKIETRTSSDSEVIIEAFSQSGVQCLNDFNGMFAIAIWDNVEERLFLVRDRFGVKPLVYYKSGKHFAFASELKAILKLPVKKEINQAALQDYFFSEYIPGDHCILKNFFKLPQGHYMVWQDGEISVKPYYLFTEKIQSRPLPGGNENAILDEFEALLASSVKYRQISDVPIGAFLSGGTDSSLICALFQKQNERPVNTFTIGFDVKGFDESAYASAVAKELKTNHKETHLSDRSSMAIVDKIVDYYDEPFAVPSAIPSYLVCSIARQNVTVAMSGDGGDELFMGYGYYPLYKKIKRLYRFDGKIGRRIIKTLFSNMGPRYERASRLFGLPSDNLMAHLWSEQQYMYSEKEIKNLLGTGQVDLSAVKAWDKIDQMPLSDYEKISLFDIDQYLAHDLLYKMDIASMASSLEVRNPYLDYRVMEFAYNLPEHYKVRNGTTKYLMKKLLERYLPKEQVYRRKWGFPAPIGDWLTRDLSYLIDKWLDPRRISSQGILNAKMVADYVSAFRAGKKFHDKRIWALIYFQMWFEKYMA